MRLLLSLILTSLFFIASQNSDASAAFQKAPTKTSELNLFQSGVAGRLEYGNQTEAIFHNSNIHNAAKTFRLLPGVLSNNLGAFFVSVEALLKASGLEKLYSFCTPIGRKLLFPKHYFW